jgi:CheY-like chemotaxis protein
MSIKILLVDGSITVQKIVEIVFSGNEYELTVVESGEEALQIVKNVVPDVMLVGAMLAGKSGFDVCREVRNDPALAHIGILLMAGTFELIDANKAKANGADEFIEKPFGSQSLLDATTKLVELSRQRRGTALVYSVDEPFQSGPEVIGEAEVIDDDEPETGFYEYSLKPGNSTVQEDSFQEQSASSAPPEIDEVQLRSIISNISGEVIERIVREVVPGIAEELIMEEIRKIKEGSER